MRLLAILFALACGCVLVVQAATQVAAGPSAAQLQAAIDACATGDTAQMPASPSTVNWTTGQGVTNVTTGTNKSIVIDLNGWTVNRSSGTTTMFDMKGVAGGVRLTNGAITQNTTGAFMLNAGGGFNVGLIRFDHLTMTGNSGTSGQFLVQFGTWPVLMDHCTLNAPGNTEFIHNIPYGGGDTTGWTQVIVPGDPNMCFVEDCTTNNNDPAGAFFQGSSAIQGYNGSRSVYRYSTLYFTHLDQHGDSVSARWWEFYGNTFTGPSGGDQSQSMGLRGGSGAIFNNNLVPFSNPSTGNLQFGPENVPSDNQTYHVGTGIISGGTPTADPAYVWGNAAGLPLGFISPVVDGVDVIRSQKPSYRPYKYPFLGAYPASATINAAGTSLTVVWDVSCTNGAGGGGGMAFSPSGGAATLTYSSGSGSATYVYSISRTILQSETFSTGLAYTQPTTGIQVPASGVIQTLTDVGSFPQVQTTAGALFTGATVTNNSTQTGGGGTSTSALVGTVQILGTAALK